MSGKKATFWGEKGSVSHLHDSRFRAKSWRLGSSNARLELLLDRMYTGRGAIGSVLGKSPERSGDVRDECTSWTALSRRASSSSVTVCIEVSLHGCLLELDITVVALG